MNGIDVRFREGWDGMGYRKVLERVCTGREWVRIGYGEECEMMDGKTSV